MNLLYLGDSESVRIFRGREDKQVSVESRAKTEALKVCTDCSKLEVSQHLREASKQGH